MAKLKKNSTYKENSVEGKQSSGKSLKPKTIEIKMKKALQVKKNSSGKKL